MGGGVERFMLISLLINVRVFGVWEDEGGGLEGCGVEIWVGVGGGGVGGF